MMLRVTDPDKFYASSHTKNAGTRGALLPYMKYFAMLHKAASRKMRSTEGGLCAIVLFYDLLHLASGGPDRGHWSGEVEDLHLILGHPLEIVERSLRILLNVGWVWEFKEGELAQPASLDRRAATPLPSPPAFAQNAPLPPIERASTYELVADRMMAMYIEAGAAEAGRLCSDDALRSALMDVCAGPNEATLLAKIEANLETHIEAASKPEMLLSLNRWPRDPRALAEPVKRTKKYKRGSTEALAVGEYHAGRMTAEQLQEMGIAV